MLQPDFKINTKKQEGDFNLIGKVKVKVLVVFSCALALLVFAQLVFASNLATDGSKISDVYSQINNLEAQNTQLRMEITQNSALANLSKEAQKEGFQKPSKVIAF